MSDLVKLEWIINDDDCAEVDTPFGTYMVGKTSYGGWWSYCFDEYYDEGSYRCKDMAEGMSLAEKHWRDRVQPITKPLTDHIEELEAKLAKAVEALYVIEGWSNKPAIVVSKVRTTLAELTSSEAANGEAKGGKDE